MKKSYLDFMKRSRSAKARGDLYVQLEVLDIEPFSVLAGRTSSVQLQVIYEPGRALSFEVTSLQDWLWVDSNGLVTIDASSVSAGSHVATIRVSDGRDVVETDLTFEVEARLFEASLKRSGVSRLPHNITLNGVTVAPTARYEGKDAVAPTWPDLSGNGRHMQTSGAPLADRPTPFLDDTRSSRIIDGVGAWSGNDAADAALIFGGTTHAVIEMVMEVTGSDFRLGTRSNSLTSPGWQVRDSASAQNLSFGLRNALGQESNIAVSVPNGLHHLLFVSSGDELAIHVDGILAKVVETVPIEEELGSGFGIGHRGSGSADVAFFALYKHTDWLDTADQAALAAERAALLWGAHADFARGSPVGSFTRSTAATLDTIDLNGERHLFTVPPHVPRLERRLNTDSRNLVAHSEKLTHESWEPVNVSVEDDAIDAPLGLRASLVTATGPDDDHYISSDVDIEADEAFVCLSFLVRAKDSSWVCLSSLVDGDGDVWIDVENAIVGTNTLTEEGTVRARRVPEHPDWVQVSLTQTALFDANVMLGPAPGDGIVSFDPSVTPASAYFTAVQVEKVADISKGPTTYSPKPYYVGYLQEGTTTNLIDNSSDFTATAWQKGEVIVDPNAVGTPFGKIYADAIIANTTNSTLHRWRHYADVVAGQFYVLSAYFKPGAQRWLRIGADHLSANAYIDTQDLDSSEMTSGINSWGYDDNFGDGWVRVWVNFTANATVQRLQYFYLQNDRSGTSFAGDGVTPGIFMFGVQCERVAHPNDGPSSLIETTGSDATRVVDNFSFSSYLNANPFAGVLACTGRALHHGSLTENDTYLASITDDVGDNRASVLWNNGQQAYLNIRKDNIQIVNAGELPIFELRDGDAHTLVGVFGKGGARLLRDGNHAFGPGSAVAPEVATKIQVGARDIPSLPFRGHLCDIRIRGDNDYEAVVI